MRTRGRKVAVPDPERRVIDYRCAHDFTSLESCGPVEAVALAAGDFVSIALWSSTTHNGFTVIDAGPDVLTLRFVDADGKAQYETILSK